MYNFEAHTKESREQMLEKIGVKTMLFPVLQQLQEEFYHEAGENGNDESAFSDAHNFEIE